MLPLPSLPQNAAAHGAVLDRQMWQTLALMLAFALLAHTLLLVGILRRRTNSASSMKRTTRWLPAALFAVFAIAIFVLTVRAEKLWAANRFQGASPAAMQVEVVGEQFVWYFRYPGADARFGATRPELVDAAAANPLGLDAGDDSAHDDVVTTALVLPAGREVDLRLRSLDVIHGFFIPAMRLKNNAVPGSEFHVHFTPQRVGTFPIACSQVCGTGHYRMGAVLLVLPPAEFDAWLAQQKPAVTR